MIITSGMSYINSQATLVQISSKKHLNKKF